MRNSLATMSSHHLHQQLLICRPLHNNTTTQPPDAADPVPLHQHPTPDFPCVKRSKQDKENDQSELIDTTEKVAQTQVKFSLLNTQGLIASGGRNKSKTISDLIVDPLSQHLIAPTKTFLTKEVEDAEIRKHFPSYTLLREIGRKHKQGGCLLLSSLMGFFK